MQFLKEVLASSSPSLFFSHLHFSSSLAENVEVDLQLSLLL